VSDDRPYRLLTVLGPTAAGKTRVAVAAARAVGGEIVSADSRQVYRGMDIGTGKDLAEYGDVPHHLIDILEPDEDFSVFDFTRRFAETSDGIRARGRVPVMCGGSALYLDAVLRGYRMSAVPENPALREELALLQNDEIADRLRALKPELHNSTDLDTRERMIRAVEIATHDRDRGVVPTEPPRSLTVGLAVEPEELRRRIRTRLRARMDAGLVDEARRLAERIPLARFTYFGLEYKHLAMLLRGKVNVEDMEHALARDIAAFAKRQRTWFRKMERNGVVIHWFAPDDLDGIPGLVRGAEFDRTP
jgi:tRNA dimethylallyltransferase